MKAETNESFLSKGSINETNKLAPIFGVSENFDESESIDLDANRASRLMVSREIRFHSRFGTRISRPKYELHNIYEDELAGYTPKSMNMLTKETPCSPKQTESDCLLVNSPKTGQKTTETNNCQTVGTPTNLQTQNFSAGTPIEEIKHDEVILSIQKRASELRQHPNQSARSSRSNRDQNPNITSRISAHESARPRYSVSNDNNNNERRRISIAGNASNQAFESQINESGIQILSEVESRIYLTRSIMFFLTLGVSSLSLVFVIQDKIPFLVLFVIFYCYWVYIVGSTLKGTHNALRENWQRKQDLLKALGAASAIFAQVCLHLKTLDQIHYSSVACIPFLILIFVSCFTKKPPQGSKVQIIAFQSLYTGQILIIGLKLDGIIDLDWIFTFGILWIYLAVVCFYFIIYGLSLIVHGLLVFFQHYRETAINPSTTSIGLLWYFAYHGLGAVACLYIVGIDQFFQEEKDPEILTNTAWGSMVLNLCLAVYTVVVFKSLQGYMQNVDWSQSLMNNSILTSRDKKDKINFVTEKKTSYFQVISPTYFVPLDPRVFIETHQKLDSSKNKCPNSTVNKRRQNTVNSTIVSLKQLHEYKDTLDKKLKVIGSKNKDNTQKKFLKLNISEIPKRSGSLVDFETSKSIPNNHQKNYSFQTELDQPSNSKRVKSIENVAETENVCYICFQKAPDTILMNCGHGGVCYECAIATVQKNNACVSCRGKIEAIHRIDPNPKVKNIIKSVELTKVIEI